EAEQFPRSLRSEPATDISGRPLARRLADSRVHGAQLLLEHERVVCPGLDVHQQAVEGCDVDAGRIEPALERLHERRSRAGEGIAEMIADLLLHFAENEPPAASHDDVELVPGHPGVSGEDAITTQAVPEHRPPLRSDSSTRHTSRLDAASTRERQGTRTIVRRR